MRHYLCRPPVLPRLTLEHRQAAAALEAESGIELEPSEVTLLRQSVLAGDWDTVDSHIWDVISNEKHAVVRSLVRLMDR